MRRFIEAFKNYFLALGAGFATLVLIIYIFFIDGSNLQDLKFFQYVTKIASILDKIGFSLITAIALVLTSIAYWENKKFKRLFFILIFTLLVSIFTKGKFLNIGSDSITELLNTNHQEAKDFISFYLLKIEWTTKQWLLLLSVLILIPIYKFLKRGICAAKRMKDIKVSLLFLLIMFFITTVYYIHNFLDGYNSISVYKASLQASSAIALEHMAVTRDAPHIVIYIGESTTKKNMSLYNYHINTSPELNEIKNDLIVFSDVITSYSHTFPSLYRAFSFSSDPYHDQFLSIKELRRANSVTIFNHFDYETYWLSNQNLAGTWDWTSQLFGKQAIHSEFLTFGIANHDSEKRKYDSALIDLYRQKMRHPKKSKQITFLHSYAGHFDYCKNIPAEARKKFDNYLTALPQEAVFGNLRIEDIDKRRAAINCYDSAMSYVDKNVRAIIDDVAQNKTPTVFIYFSDHGEDVFEGTGHESHTNSFRHIEVPFLVYFNTTARTKFPELYEAAKSNKDKRYSLEWFSDSMLDLAGITDKNRELISIFKYDLSAPSRYSLRRSDLTGHNSIIAIDDEDRAKNYNLSSDGHDLFFKRRIIRSFSPRLAEKFCAYQSNSLLKYNEASTAFSCVQLEIVIDEKSREIYVASSNQVSRVLKLKDFIKFAPNSFGKLLLDVNIVNEAKIDIVINYLDAIIEKSRRSNIVIEMPLFNELSDHKISKIHEAGYQLSFVIPKDLANHCADNSHQGPCAIYKNKIAVEVKRSHLGLSFDIGLTEFIESLNLDENIKLNIRQRSIKNKGDINLPMLNKSAFYVIPYRSAFDN